VISRLSQTKRRLELSRLHLYGVEVGQHRREQLDRVVDVDDPMRLAEQQAERTSVARISPLRSDVGPRRLHRIRRIVRATRWLLGPQRT
jgi:hypothetical protein